jgi:phosphoribosyl 1,2-cyclic phosphodiesterase
MRAIRRRAGGDSTTGEAPIPFRVTILASGSSGNLTLLETARTRLLVDVGLSRRETIRRLAAVGVSPEQLDGILISHEHTDHAGGLPALTRHWPEKTIYLTEGTHEALCRALPAEQVVRIQRVEYIQAGRSFSVGDIEVDPFRVPHDAADPLAFSFRANGTKLALVTDLGYLPELVKLHLRDSDCLILESNHDVEMLKVGPYPWHVKQRVLSRTGHLSNHAVSEFLADAEGFDGRARYLVLAHLSEQNNHPDIARLSAEEALSRRPEGCARFQGQLLVASQWEPLGPIAL